jgi:hypothetical protein
MPSFAAAYPAQFVLVAEVSARAEAVPIVASDAVKAAMKSGRERGIGSLWAAGLRVR